MFNRHDICKPAIDNFILFGKFEYHMLQIKLDSLKTKINYKYGKFNTALHEKNPPGTISKHIVFHYKRWLFNI